MNALHPKTSQWIGRGIFDDLKSFADFEARVNGVSEEKDRGDIFEIFVEGYLATQPITQRVKHWIVGDIPLPLRERYKLPRDATGIDGIYETHDGSQVAYQVKYRQKQHLTFAEVAPFLGITEQFEDRVIFTNAAALSDKAIQRTRWVGRDAFADLSPNALRCVEAWLKVKPVPIVRATPDPTYQVQALADIRIALETHDRATAVMACGTGKTLVALWASEQAAPKTVLVLVPSLTLLQQTLREWSEHTSWGDRFSYICVCSDESVDLRGDSWRMDKSDVGFRVDTDPSIVREFLQRETADIRIVFSTYHSSPVVGEGAKDLPAFDFAIFDEAHKTTGHSGTAFNYALSDQNIRIRKRLFLTATPRHIDIRHRDKEGEFRVQSMNDVAVYGPRAHTLSFAAAAAKGIICRYKVIVSLIDKQMVDDFARNNGITLVTTDEIATRWMANLIALVQAVNHVKAKKIISFHSRIRLAQEFASSEPRGVAHYLRDFDVRHVNGGQSSAERSEVVRAFSDAPRSLLTNARCLTEGVNIPAVDMVAFIDPRRSRIDVAQAVGRAMRKPRRDAAKQLGYVLVPVFAGSADADSIGEAIKSERFDVVADVLNALQEQDDDFVDIVREIKQRKGEGEPFNPRRLVERLEVIGPRVDLDHLTESIALEVADRIGTSWDEWYGVLLRYRGREGHCRVPQHHVEGELRLGVWVGTQRKTRETMPAERRKRLDALGFEWDMFASAWERGFAALEKFRAREGHCRLPDRHVEGEHRLWTWVLVQRRARETMPAERRRRLDALGFDWDPHASAWEEGFTAFEKFRAREGHCLVPAKHVEGELRLGAWVSSQRYVSETMPVERKQRLDALGFEWDPLASAWEAGFAALEKFRAREGHCRVLATHVEGEFGLGVWVNHQRRAKETMPAERRQRFDALGFEWKVLANAWEDAFAALEKFRAREGHWRIPYGHVEGGLRLGIWVSTQRVARETMPAERRQRLDALGFEWNLVTSTWEEAFAALEKYRAREGHCLVPNRHVEGDLRLGAWVGTQRYVSEAMPVERKQRLDALGFEWDPLASGWEEAFVALERFRAREGHCRVPAMHVERGLRLGFWVATQRKARETIPAERRQRLDALGFEWKVLANALDEAFAALEEFRAREGHCRVPGAHTEGKFRLGIWVSNQRNAKETMPAERRQRFDALGFEWTVRANAWEDAFAALEKFRAREGHCLVPNRHVEGKFRLGTWVSNQRNANETMPAERRQRLGALGFEWKAKMLANAWDEAFAALEKFRAREGHCRVPGTHTEGKFRLGIWVSRQRLVSDTMPAERRQRLDVLGFEWDLLAGVWEKAFAALEEFRAREGHCLVPGRHVEGELRLGRWVLVQRQARETMPAERRRRLDALGFEWDPHASAWEEGFAALEKFRAREGHCLVPAKHVEGELRLGVWVSTQRYVSETMPAERRQRLEAIGFEWAATRRPRGAAT